MKIEQDQRERIDALGVTMYDMPALPASPTHTPSSPLAGIVGVLDKDGKPIAQPKLFVFSNCTAFLRTVPVLRHDPRSPKTWTLRPRTRKLKKLKRLIGRQLSTASIAVPEAFRYIFWAIATTEDRRKEAVNRT